MEKRRTARVVGGAVRGGNRMAGDSQTDCSHCSDAADEQEVFTAYGAPFISGGQCKSLACHG